MDDLIPCEFCGESIRFNEYHSHINQTHRRDNLVIAYDDEDLGIVNISIGHLQNLMMQMAINMRGNEDAENTRIERNRLGISPEITYAFIAYDQPEEIEMNDYEFNMFVANTVGKVEIGVTNIEDVITDVDKAHDDICTICQTPFSELEKEVRIVKTLCKHYFCRDCIITWLAKHKRCPVCMVDLEEKNLKEGTKRITCDCETT